MLLTAAACARSTGAGRTRPADLGSGTFRDSTGQRVGVATLADSSGAVRLGISVGELSPGLHGLHFHAQAECSPPDFASAGAHLNPEGRRHGRLNPEGPHLGDLPNLLVRDDGSADTTIVLGAETPLRAGPIALVIHAGPDDERTDPSGNSGARIACAVVEPG
jgi:Cu-Zn family superoxide dismutase